MAEHKRICCAIDFSEPSRFAMAEACDLARQLRAELILLHVYDARLLAAGEMGVSPRELFELAVKEMEPTTKSYQDEAAQMLGHPVQLKLVAGYSADEITRFAREKSIDLLVIATHGRSGLTRLVLGSVAEQVVRQADCPVLVVRSQAGTA